MAHLPGHGVQAAIDWYGFNPLDPEQSFKTGQYGTGEFGNQNAISAKSGGGNQNVLTSSAGNPQALGGRMNALASGASGLVGGFAGGGNPQFNFSGLNDPQLPFAPGVKPLATEGTTKGGKAFSSATAGVNPGFSGGTSGDTMGGGVSPAGGGGQRPIDILAQSLGLSPVQAWQQLQQQAANQGVKPIDLLNQKLQGGPSQIGMDPGQFNSGSPANPSQRPIDILAAQMGVSPIQAWQQLQQEAQTMGVKPIDLLNQRLQGGDVLDSGPIGGGTPGGDTGGGTGGGFGPLGGPRGTGTEDDPMFGSNTPGAADELPGGREGGFQFRTTPGYEFRLQQAQQALENSAAARGGLLSGNTLKDLTRFGQGLAEEEFQNVFNMLGNLRNPGSTQTMSNAASNLGANVGNLLSRSGQAQAGGILGGNQAWQRGVGGGLGILTTLSSGGNLPPVGFGPGTGSSPIFGGSGTGAPFPAPGS